jgi:hypothetical protein
MGRYANILQTRHDPGAHAFDLSAAAGRHLHGVPSRVPTRGARHALADFEFWFDSGGAQPDSSRVRNECAGSTVAPAARA